MRVETKLTEWLGVRAPAGRVPPNGFPRSRKFGDENPSRFSALLRTNGLSLFQELYPAIISHRFRSMYDVTGYMPMGLRLALGVT